MLYSEMYGAIKQFQQWPLDDTLNYSINNPVKHTANFIKKAFLFLQKFSTYCGQKDHHQAQLLQRQNILNSFAWWIALLAETCSEFL